jgi:DNA-binding NarL/FixJ family response regulator
MTSRGILTTRELEVLHLLVECKSNKQIATHLAVCEKTIEFHLSNIYSKIAVKTRSEAIVWVLRQRVIQETRDFPS